MPGTPIQHEESFTNYAHKRAIEIARQSADPAFQPQLFYDLYWTAMRGFGFHPYEPGRP